MQIVFEQSVVEVCKSGWTKPESVPIHATNVMASRKVA